MTVAAVTVTARLADLLQAGSDGRLVARPSVPVIEDTAGHVLLAGIASAPMTAGVATLALPPTDSGVNPTGYTYTLSLYGRGNKLVAEATGIPLAAGSGPWEFADLVDLDPVEDTTTYLSSLANHLGDTTDAHDASAIAFTPTGTIAADDTQAAVAGVAKDAHQTPPRIIGARPAATLMAGGSGTLGASTAASSTLSDTGDVFVGSSSVRMTTKGDGGFATYTLPIGSTWDLSASTLRVYLKLESYTGLNYGIIYAATDSGFNNRYSWQFTETSLTTGERAVREGKWVVLDVPRGVFAVNGGSPTWNSITHLRVSLTDLNTAVPVTVRIGGFGHIPDNSAFSSGAAVFYFADTTADHWTTARPKLDAVGARGCLFPIVDNMGAGTYTVAQARALVQRGWDVGVHALSNTDHALSNIGQTEDWCRQRFQSLRTWADRNGFQGNLHLWSGASPGSDELADWVSRDYFTLSIGAQGVQSAHSPDVTRWRRIAITSTVSLATAQGWVDKAKASAAPVVLSFHQIVASGATGNNWNVADFNSLVDYVVAQGVPIVTLSEVLQRMPHV